MKNLLNVVRRMFGIITEDLVTHGIAGVTTCPMCDGCMLHHNVAFVGQVLVGSFGQQRFLDAHVDANWRAMSAFREWDSDADLWVAKGLECPVREGIGILLLWNAVALDVSQRLDSFVEVHGASKQQIRRELNWEQIRALP